MEDTADFELIEKTIQETESKAYLSPRKKKDLAMLNELLKDRKKSFLGEVVRPNSAFDGRSQHLKKPKKNRMAMRRTIKLDDTPPKKSERLNTDKIKKPLLSKMNSLSQ